MPPPRHVNFSDETQARGETAPTAPVLSRRELLALGGAAALMGSTASGRDGGAEDLPRSARQALDRFVPVYLKSMNAPGLALSVVQADRRHCAVFGFADSARRSAVTDDQLFQVGSISKSFVALVLLQMQDEGKCEVNDSIRAHLPWLRIAQASGSVTIHHLLTHTSGFADNLPLFPPDGRAWQPTSAPGERFHYSNWGYDVLGRLIESIDGCSCGVSIERRIMRPLGMHESAGAITADIRPRLVPSFVPRDDDRPYLRRGALVPAGPLNYTAGSGCVAATARDMAKYLSMLLNGGAGPAGRLVSSQAFEAFTTAHVMAPDFGPAASYGYGIAVDATRGTRVLRHTGGMVSFMSSMQINLGDGVAAFASINAQQGYRPNRLVRYAVRVAGGSQNGPAASVVEPADEEIRADEPSQYAGRYAGADGRPLTILVKDGHPALVLAGKTIRLQPMADDVYVADDPQFALFPLVFERASTGNAATGPRLIIGIGHGAQWYARAGASVDSQSTDRFAAYEGVFYSENPWVGTIRVVARRQTLWLNGLTPLAPTGEHVFRFADEPASPEVAEFSALVLGKAQIMSISGNPLRRI